MSKISKHLREILALSLALCLLAGLTSASATAVDSGFMMTVNNGTNGTNGTLSTQGFEVIMYNTASSGIFGDQKCGAMEMILHGKRIATNGDVRLLPTPEQWDPTPTRSSRSSDRTNNRLTATLTYPAYPLNYTLVAEPEPGGFKVTVNLTSPLPEILAGRASFSLEFLPSAYIGKSYMVDKKKFGVFPDSPLGPLEMVPPITDDPINSSKYPWVQEWDEQRGPYQALPMISGTSMIFAPDDKLTRISITSDSGDLMLYDGRNRAQNGWFVLRTLIPSGKTNEAVVWHIKPGLIPNWTRDPVITHSQVGYAPNFQKVAVIEIDPNFDAPNEAKLLRRNGDGTYTEVFKGPISDPVFYLRYNYSKFDFSSYKEPGMYVIEYAGKRSDLFRIDGNVYSNVWQSCLSSFLAVQMDHMRVREGYKIWHNASHMDDARQAPPNITHFDGWSMGATIDSGYKPGERIPGLNIGGWYDAGDFDIQTGSQNVITQHLNLAALEFNVDLDVTTVDWDWQDVELHRPDGSPDILAQVKQGALQLLAQLKSVGFSFPVIEAPTLRQYTHIGSGASDTDGYFYNSKLGINEVDMAKGTSGKPDDRWAFAGTKQASLQYNAATSLAGAYAVLKNTGYDDKLANECLAWAERIWNEEAHTGTADWNAAIELFIATGKDVYKQRILAILPNVTSTSQMASNGWKAARLIPYMDEAFKTQLETATRAYVTSVDSQMASTPYGVPTTTGMWGGSGGVVDMGIRMFILHKAFPDIVSPEYTLRALNYVLGAHPVSSISWVTGVGTRSVSSAYGTNRGFKSFIRGGIVPGYVTIQPNFPEFNDNFNFLWFTHEYCTDVSAKWIVLGNAADAIVKGKVEYYK